MYWPITMRFDGVSLSHVEFGKGRASVLTSRKRSDVERKTTIFLTYTFCDFRPNLIVYGFPSMMVCKSLLNRLLHFCIESDIFVAGPIGREAAQVPRRASEAKADRSLPLRRQGGKPTMMWHRLQSVKKRGLGLQPEVRPRDRTSQARMDRSLSSPTRGAGNARTGPTEPSNGQTEESLPLRAQVGFPPRGTTISV